MALFAIQYLFAMQYVLNRKSAPTVPAGQVEQMLAIIHRDKRATVYLNELPLRSQVRVKRAVKAGEPVTTNDILDVERLVFCDVNIPADAGYVAVVSVGWRKAVIFDYAPLAPDEGERLYDPEVLFGQVYAELLFQELCCVTDDEWSSLFAEGWFPFRCLSQDLIQRMLSHIREGWHVDGLLTQIGAEAKDVAARALETWRRHEVFKDHMEVIAHALERYGHDDYISTVSTLFPRIEGFMRSVYVHHERPGHVTGRRLADVAIPTPERLTDRDGPLLPVRFREYVNRVYFCSFDPTHMRNPASRHSVAHGTADQSNFNQKAATVGVLTLIQLSYYITARQREGADDSD